MTDKNTIWTAGIQPISSVCGISRSERQIAGSLSRWFYSVACTAMRIIGRYHRFIPTTISKGLRGVAYDTKDS